MNRSMLIAASLFCAAAAPAAIADQITIGFEGSPVFFINELGVFDFSSEDAATGSFSYDLDEMPAFNVGGNVLGIFNIDSLEAIAGGAQSFSGDGASVLILNDVRGADGEIVDTLEIRTGRFIEFPEEQVSVGVNVTIVGPSDWLTEAGSLPDSDTLGLERATRATVQIGATIVQEPFDFVTDSDGDGTADAFEDQDGNGILDGFEDSDGDGILDGIPNPRPERSEAIFELTSLSANGILLKRFEGEVDLSVAGDVNADEAVDTADLIVVLGNFNTSTTLRSKGDLNDDGQVDTADLLEVLANFNS